MQMIEADMLAGNQKRLCPLAWIAEYFFSPTVILICRLTMELITNEDTRPALLLLEECVLKMKKT